MGDNLGEEETQSLEDLESNLRLYTEQYEEIKLRIAEDPHNEELLALEKELEELISLTADVIVEAKTGPEGPEDGDATAAAAAAGEMEQATEGDLAAVFPPGSLIDAKFFEDDQFYPAQVVGVTEKGYIVRFDGYNNEEEVTPDSIKFRETEEEKPKKKRKADTADPYANVPTQVPDKFKVKPDDPEDVKQRKKKQAHAVKSKMRFAKQSKEQDSKKSNWQGFLKGKGAKRKSGFLTSTKKESIFKSPDSLDGKVGVVGSGKGMTSYLERVRHDFQD